MNVPTRPHIINLLDETKTPIFTRTIDSMTTRSLENFFTNLRDYPQLSHYYCQLQQQQRLACRSQEEGKKNRIGDRSKGSFGDKDRQLCMNNEPSSLRREQQRGVRRRRRMSKNLNSIKRHKDPSFPTQLFLFMRIPLGSIVLMYL